MPAVSPLITHSPRSSGTVRPSRLPIPSRVPRSPISCKSPSITSARVTPTASTPTGSQVKAGSAVLHGVSVIKSGEESGIAFPSPKPVRATTGLAQRPKYQLRDPGVSVIASRIPRPGRNVHSAPNATRPITHQVLSTVQPSIRSQPATPVLGRRSVDTIPSPSPKPPAQLYGSRNCAKQSGATSTPVPPDSPRLPVTSTSMDLDKTPTLSSRQSTMSLSSLASISASSSYSSASSMARARAALQQWSQPYNDTYPSPVYEKVAHEYETECAPYLVPHHGPEMTLTWMPDPEACERDPAAELWKELEQRMGRKIRATSIRDRGRWVASKVKGQVPAGEHRPAPGMDRVNSEFTISEYYIPEDEEEELEKGATALFDMSGPLITSLSSFAATPANTPCIRRETLQRVGRIRRRTDRTSSSDSQDSMSIPVISRGSSYADTRTDYSLITDDWDIHRPKSRYGEEMMCRLDSHIVSALAALQEGFNSPDLDIALGIDIMEPYLTDDEDLKVHLQTKESPDSPDGLGLGVPIGLTSIYHLPTQSPRARAGRYVSRAEPAHGKWRDLKEKVRELLKLGTLQRQPGGEAAVNHNPEGKDGYGLLRVKDLDTGLVRAVCMGELGEQLS